MCILEERTQGHILVIYTIALINVWWNNLYRELNNGQITLMKGWINKWKYNIQYGNDLCIDSVGCTMMNAYVDTQCL
jgi:hypothetical protein